MSGKFEINIFFFVLDVRCFVGVLGNIVFVDFEFEWVMGVIVIVSSVEFIVFEFREVGDGVGFFIRICD